MMMRNIPLLLFFLCFKLQVSLAQNPKADSLRNVIRTSKTDTGKVNAYELLMDELRWLSPEEGLACGKTALLLSQKIGYNEGQCAILTSAGRIYNQIGNSDTALYLYQKALKIARSKKLVANEVYTLTSLADLYRLTSKYDEALKAFEEIRVKAQKNKMITAYSNSLNGMGIIYRRKNQLPKALDFFQKSAAIAEKEKNYQGYCNSMTNIALVYDEMKQPEKAKSIYRQIIPILEKNNENQKTLANALMNMGTLYIDEYAGKVEQDSALFYHHQALEIAEKNNIKKIVGSVCVNIGIVYLLKEDYPTAEKYFIRSLKIRREINDKSGEALCISNLCDLYISAGQFDKAAKLIGNAIRINEEIGDSMQLKDAYHKASLIFGEKKDFAKAYRYRLMFDTLEEKIYNSENNRLMNEMQTKYETDKKEQQNLLLKKENDLSAKTIKQQKLVSWFIIGGLLLVLIFSGFMYNRYKVTQQQKSIIEEQKHKVVEAYEELNQQNEEISAQRDEIEHQKHLVEAHQKEVMDSITYAKRIQDAILPPIDLIKEKLPDTFVLYKPKDIVAGDFYWMEEINGTLFIAVADCTGHGVPGAMVSVVCSNALNRAVKEFLLSDPGKVLDKVTDLVLETFERSGADVKDGMDISLLSIEYQDMGIENGDMRKRKPVIKWSGANNPLWYFAPVASVTAGNETISPNDVFELKEITADKQPIGKSDHRKAFTTHTIEYKPGTLFYLFTDGYADQFGGPKGKKFKYKQFKEILAINHHLEPEEQSKIFDKRFEEWKGKLEQVDDVSIIGIRL